MTPCEDKEVPIPDSGLRSLLDLFQRDPSQLFSETMMLGYLLTKALREKEY